MGFTLQEDGEPFDGFRWRTTEELDVNFLWLLHYVTEGAVERNRVTDANPRHRVLFDHVVVAREYIGPIQPVD